HAVSLYPPNNLVTVTFAILFARLLIEWRRINTGPTITQILRWHGLPVAISFLLPQRLSVFAWYLGPLNVGEAQKPPLREAIAFYQQAVAADYHVAAWSMLVAAVLFLLALLTVSKWRTGGAVLIWLVLISAASAVAHPNQKSRFLHSWWPAAWVAGAAGLA